MPAIAFVHLAYQGHEGLSVSQDLAQVQKSLDICKKNSNNFSKKLTC